MLQVDGFDIQWLHHFHLFLHAFSFASYTMAPRQVLTLPGVIHSTGPAAGARGAPWDSRAGQGPAGYRCARRA